MVNVGCPRVQVNNEASDFVGVVLLFGLVSAGFGLFLFCFKPNLLCLLGGLEPHFVAQTSLSVKMLELQVCRLMPGFKVCFDSD